MSKEQILDIASKISEGIATPEEMATYILHVNDFVKKYPEWEHLNEAHKEKIGEEMKSFINNHIKSASLPAAAPHPIKLWRRIAIAATVSAMMLSAGLFFYKKTSHPSVIAYKNDCAPGKQGATLTLANGKKIKLSDAANGQLAKEAGVVITKSSNGQLIYTLLSHSGSVSYNTLSTDKGETYQLRLPDGSQVWLNAASTLTYSSNLGQGKDKRSVKLTGEGYFEIAKDKAHPFVVESENQEVTVLGTHFNLNSYPDEKATTTTLLEGSVKVLSSRRRLVKGDLYAVVLKPGEQSINTGNEINVSPADENATAWKDGKFRFSNTSLETILRQFSRWYNVDITYVNGIPDEKFTGGIDRNLSAAEALEIFKYMKINFKIEGRTIYVTK